MTQYVVGLREKTRSRALTIDAEDALIAALKAKQANPEATITYVRKSNRRGDSVIRMKDCPTRNEPSVGNLGTGRRSYGAALRQTAKDCHFSRRLVRWAFELPARRVP
jgi:hypothetical protein